MVPPTIRTFRPGLRCFAFVIALLFFSFQSFSQSSLDSLLNKIDPQQWAASIGKKARRVEDKIIAKSQKTLQKLQRQEVKIYHKMLGGKDSLQAKMALSDIKLRYQALQDKLKSPVSDGVVKAYMPKLDSLNSALKFVNGNFVAGNIKHALVKTESLQCRFQQAEEIKNFIRQRKLQLREQLEKLGLAKQLKKFNKQAYYYSAQIREYASLLKDSKKAERKVLELLSTSKLFKDFMRKNSLLASLFRLPGDPYDPVSQAGLAGLQTRTQVNNLIEQRLATGGAGAQQQFRQNVQDAQSQLNQLKNKVSQLGGGSSDFEMPEGFKPNNQKTKSFWKRLEVGTNIQTQKATNFFPVTSDIGLSLGYKLNDKSVIGIGGSYKIGLGKGWNHLRLSHEGIGVRSFVDWKVKGSFWLSGGYEMNYKDGFNSIVQLRDVNAWQQSGLIGVSKVISIKSKFFKKTKLQLLWDFLSYLEVPRVQPVLFRVGYNF